MLEVHPSVGAREHHVQLVVVKPGGVLVLRFFFLVILGPRLQELRRVRTAAHGHREGVDETLRGVLLERRVLPRSKLSQSFRNHSLGANLPGAHLRLAVHQPLAAHGNDLEHHAVPLERLAVRTLADLSHPVLRPPARRLAHGKDVAL